MEENGYAILGILYLEDEMHQILSCIENADSNESSSTKTKDLYAIRQLFKIIPDLATIVFSEKLKEVLFTYFRTNYFLTKAIYFDKPNQSNWFVAYHQDLSISVDKKIELEDYRNWTFKKGQYGVQPPLEILQNTVTVRIHLDKTDKHNGALRMIPKSHLHGIIRTDSKDWNLENETICEVEKGGVMLMKPLILHASHKTTNGERRRVLHLEFNTRELEEPLRWLERYEVNNSYNELGIIET